MPFRLFYWYLLLPAGWLALWVAAIFLPKVRAALLGRLGVWRRFGEALRRRDYSLPLVWVHAASAGEFLQAEPVLRRLRRLGGGDSGGEGGGDASGSGRAPSVQFAVTLSSASGLRWLERIAGWPELVWGDLLPLDSFHGARRLLSGLRPDALVYVQADLWPGLIWTAHGRGIPQVLIAARIGRRGNYRARFPLRLLFRGLYRRLDAILCATERDRAGLASIAPDHPSIEAAGDPGIETVLARLEEAAPARRPPGWEGAVLVAGSTWPADEELLFPVLLSLMESFPTLRAVMAPHEPEEGHLARMEHALEPVGTFRLSQWEAAEAGSKVEAEGEGRPEKSGQGRVMLVDSVGRLASLYRLGSIAYVGGGFGSGVHNLAEPAARGMPVLFGPRHGNSAMAALLLEAEAGFVAHNAAELRGLLRPLLEDAAAAAAKGEAARRVVEGQAGAAERCFEAVRARIPALREAGCAGP